ncbi:unannotated protein [freshwater metagenome]|uniref:Unannotated protein n=1 Tax=freshwater metagenome TaxID=449393 RepID=A0A6J6DYI0_9ZZZZ
MGRLPTLRCVSRWVSPKPTPSSWVCYSNGFFRLSAMVRLTSTLTSNLVDAKKSFSTSTNVMVVTTPRRLPMSLPIGRVRQYAIWPVRSGMRPVRPMHGPKMSIVGVRSSPNLKTTPTRLRLNPIPTPFRKLSSSWPHRLNTHRAISEFIPAAWCSVTVPSSRCVPLSGLVARIEVFCNGIRTIAPPRVW